MPMMRMIMLASCFVFSLALTAQKRHKAEERVVEGYYQLLQTGDMTSNECKQKVIQQARLDAVAKSFGTYLSGNSVSVLSSTNGDGDESFNYYNTIDVRGIWMGDIDEPRIKSTPTDNGTFLWEAWVKGKAHERSVTSIDFDVRMLVNGTTLRHEAYELYERDHFGFYFRTPEKGYLMIFLTDGKLVNRLPLDNTGKTIVDANTDYIFPKDLNSWFTADVGEGKQVEYDRLIVLFSKNGLSPRNAYASKRSSYEDEANDATITPLPETKYSDFNKYYEKLFNRDPSLQPKIMDIVLKRRK